MEADKTKTMKLNTYLVFDGRCEEAFQFYAKVFGGEVKTLIRHGGTPAEQFVPPDWLSKVMHAEVTVGNTMLMGSDAPPDRYQPMGGFSVSVQVDQPAEAERIFGALADGATVRMPIQETFWAQRFGMLVDRFGTPWMINCMKQQ
jgi:PhnB protein